MLQRALQFSTWSEQQNLRVLAIKCDLDQSERKYLQLCASADQTKSQVDASLQLAVKSLRLARD